MEDLEYEERAEKVMPKWSSWGGGIVEIKKKYWYESRNRIISILKQLHRAKKRAERIKELEGRIKRVCDLINNKGKVSKWKILNWLSEPRKGKGYVKKTIR